MEDIATLGIRVDSSTADKSGDDLNKLTKASREAEGSTKSLTKASDLLGASLRLLGVASVGAALTKAASDARAFDTAMREISTLVDTTKTDMAGLTKEVLEQSKAFGAMPTEQAKALYEIMSAGASSAAEATETLTVANKAAIGGVTSVAVAADGLTTVLNSYNMAATEATRVSDIMFAANAAGKTNIEELSSSLGKVTPIAAAAGVSFEEVAAAVGALTKGGISTAESVTGLRAVIASIIKPSDEAAKLAKSLGLEYTSTALASKGLAGFLEDLRIKTKGNQDQMAILVGGVEALNPVMALTANNGKAFSEALDNVKNSAGATEVAFNKMMAGPGKQLDVFFSTVAVKSIEIGSALLEYLGPALAFVNKNFDEIVTVLGAVAVAIGTYAAAVTVGTLVTTAMSGSFGIWIGTIVTAYTQLGLLTAAEIAATSGAVGLAAGVNTLTAAIARNPVGIFAVALAALAASFFLTRGASDELAIALGKQSKMQEAIVELSKRQADSLSKVASATGEARKEAIAHTAALLNEARAAQNAAVMMLALRVALAQAAEDQARERVREGQKGSYVERLVAGEYISSTNASDQQKSLEAQSQSNIELQKATQVTQQATDNLKNYRNQVEALLNPLTNMNTGLATNADVSSKASKATDSLKDSFADYIQNLKDATVTLGMTENQAKKFEIDGKAAEAAKAGFGALAAEITRVGNAYMTAKAAQDVADIVKSINEETAAIGKNALEVRNLDIAKRLLNATTEDERQKIIAAGQAREQALANHSQEEFTRNVLTPLQTEIKLLGLTGAARAYASLELEKEAFLYDQVAKGIFSAVDQLKNWEDYKAAKGTLIDWDANLEGAKEFTDSLNRIADTAADMASSMQSAFGDVGGSIGDLVAQLADYQAKQAEINEKVVAGTLTQGKAEQQLGALRSKLVADQISGVKSIFDKKSTAYKVMDGLEKAYAALQLANTLKSIVMDTTKTASSVANSMTRGAADQAAGAAKIFAELGPWAFPVVAAMVAVLAGLGLKGGGGGGSGVRVPTAEEMQAGQGTGTVLGDSSAKSNSIANALTAMLENTNKDLEYSNETVKFLRSIDSNIGNLTAVLSRQLGLSGGVFSTDSLGLGSTQSKGGIIGALFGTKVTRTLVDQGVKIAMGVLGEIETGIDAVGYSVVEEARKKKFLGITVSNKKSYTTTENPLGDDVERQIGLVFANIRDSLISATKSIGLDVADYVNNFAFGDVTISLKDLTGEEIEKELNAVFSSFADQIATAATDVSLHITEFQQAGEGVFETLMRIIRDVQVVDTALKSVGLSIEATSDFYTGIKNKESLLEKFGGADNFVDAISTYQEKFLTQAEQMAPVISAVANEMGRLGQSGITTNDQFKALVSSLDLNSEAGQTLFASLMAVAPAFAEVNKYLDSIANGEAAKASKIAAEAHSLEIRLAQTLGDTQKVLTMKREDELNAVDILNRSLLQMIFTAEDAATATKELANAQAQQAAVAKEAQSWNLRLLRATGQGALAQQMEDEATIAAAPESIRDLVRTTLAAERALQNQQNQPAPNNVAGPSNVNFDNTKFAINDNVVNAANDNAASLQQARLDKINDITGQLVSNLQDELDARKSVVDELKSARDGLLKFSESLFTIDNGFKSQGSVYNELIKASKTGDYDLIKSLGQEYIKEAESKASSILDTQKAIAFVASLSESSVANLDKQISDGERQIAQQQKLIDLFTEVKDQAKANNELLAELKELIGSGNSANFQLLLQAVEAMESLDTLQKRLTDNGTAMRTA